MTRTVGIVGVGAMGSAFAERLLQVGVAVVIHNRSKPAVDRLVAQGALAADSPGDLARQSETILTVLPEAGDVRAVCEGNGGVLEAAPSGSLVIDCSTIEPAQSRALAAAAADRGIAFADAGVGALPADARAGRVNFMFGSAPEDEDRVSAALQPLAASVRRCGPPGAGVTVKLINNLLANAIHVADLEAIAMAQRAGIDLDVLFAALGVTAAENRYLRDRMPAELIERDHVPGFSVDLTMKDVRIGCALADELGVPLTALAAPVPLLRQAQSHGYGALANTVLHAAFQETLAAEPIADRAVTQ